MKFYLTSFFLIIFSVQFLQAQDVPADGSKSEFPNLKKESLQLETDVELYPNPAVEYLSVSLKNSRLKNVEIEMYNIIGNKLTFDMEAVSSDKYKINVKDLNSGYYLIIVKDPVTRFNKAYKFRKQ
jgi:hypothetical protein